MKKTQSPPERILALLLVPALHLALIPASQADVAVVDGDFNAQTTFNGNFGTTYQSDAGEGWHFPAAHVWDLDPANEVAYAASSSGAPGLTQVVADGRTSKGSHEIVFSLVNTEGDATPNSFEVQVYGVNGDFSLSNWNDSAPSGAATLVDSGNLATGTFPSTEFVAHMDLGTTGYDYIAIRFRAVNVNPAAGDIVILDDVVVRPSDGPPAPAQTVEAFAADNDTGESWPEEGAILLRRTSGEGELHVPFTLSGDAELNVDYRVYKGPLFSTAGDQVPEPFNWIRYWNSTVVFPDGVVEMIVHIVPEADGVPEGSDPETVRFEVFAGDDNQVRDGKSVAEVKIWDESVPSREEAVRLLMQAAFGPGVSWHNGSYRDDIAIVQDLGIAGWIDWQFAQPARKLQSTFDAMVNDGYPAGIKTKQPTFYHNMLGYPAPLRPYGSAARLPERDYDPLRQRVAYALSQILVISENQNTLGVNADGMIHYYDEALIENAFGNYRDVLLDVTHHPAMGVYLSHLRNQQATFDENGNELTSPDENYAREILQLFSIGTVELRNNGTPITAEVTDGNGDPVLDGSGDPVLGAVSSYSNDEIVEFARVFTGLTYSDADNFRKTNGDFTSFMQSMDAEELWGTQTFQYHDTAPKTLLSRSPVNKTLGSSDDLLVMGGVAYGGSSATQADIAAAVDNIFYHPNVGPFLGRLMIQRFTISNPLPAYIGGVANAFNDSGGVRGDMKALVREILMHPDARDYNRSNRDTAGALREPFLRQMHLTRTFPVDTREDGYLGLYYLEQGLSQRPFDSPSVFNFYLPDFVPPDAEAIAAGIPAFEQIRSGLVGPEFQISTGGKLTKQLVHLTDTITLGVNGPGRGPTYDLSRLYAVADDPDTLVRELDLLLCAGRMPDLERKIITDTIRALNPENFNFINAGNIEEYRVETALGLTVISPSFSILR